MMFHPKDSHAPTIPEAKKETATPSSLISQEAGDTTQNIFENLFRC
jgi:hypothetical protein